MIGTLISQGIEACRLRSWNASDAETRQESYTHTWHQHPLLLSSTALDAFFSAPRRWTQHLVAALYKHAHCGVHEKDTLPGTPQTLFIDPPGLSAQAR